MIDITDKPFYYGAMCWKCKNPLKAEDAVSRTAVCETCGVDVRSCKNCLHYSPGAHYDCHETVDESVSDKERANFCGYFSLNTNGCASLSNTKSGADSKKAFNSLFGD